MRAPKHIGKYEILEEIGRGSFAVVYKTRDTTLDRIGALKVLHPHVAENATFVQRFKQEARTAANLDNPHIVTIHEVSEEAGWYYLAMAFLPGQTLDKWLAAAEGSLPLKQTVLIMEQVASALDAIHQRGLVHRDVKPTNIIVDDEGQATLLDFGIVRAADGTQLTTTGAVMGTPQYMSPEQAEGDQIDHRSDVYALGVVAYQMCTGRAPFDDISPVVVLRLHADKSPPPPQKLNPHLPVQVEQVLLKALAKEREKRYQSAGELARALREAVGAAEQARRREEQLAERYGKLQESIQRQDWGSVEVHCRDILALEPGYRDVEALHRQAEVELRQKEAKERQAHLAKLYERLHAAVTTEDWGDVLALGGQVRALDSNYRDVAELMEQAREHLRRPQRPSVPVWAWITGGAVVLMLLVGLSGWALSWWPLLQPTSTPSLTATPTGSLTSTPTGTPTPIPTLTPTPTGTPTPIPTGTSTSTPTATPTDTPTPTATPTPRPVAPTLEAPSQGKTFKNPIEFRWSGSLYAGQSYQVTVRHTESDYVVQSEPLTSQTWTKDLPAENDGEWRWTVSIVQGTRTVVTSNEWMFWFGLFNSNGDGDSPSSTRPPPTPAKD